MSKRESGFSLIELLVVMGVMGFVLAAGSDMFVTMLRGYKQQGTIAETNIEGVIGLEMLRRDIESAGYGLPWQISTTPPIQYNEAADTTAAHYNDSPTNPPRGLLCGDNITSDANLVNGADYLVIKALNLSKDDAGTKWAYLLNSGATTSEGAPNVDLAADDRIIVMSPGAKDETKRRVLRGPVGTGALTLLRLDGASAFSDADETRIVYGVAHAASGEPLRMPFNRADYRVSKSDGTPGRCALGTGVLVKSIINQSDGMFNSLPLLDCVADMQVITSLDILPSDGQPESVSNGFTASTAAEVRKELYEVHVYILAQEGQRDVSYDCSSMYPSGTILVGESSLLGRYFDLSTITNWQNYRWRVYTLIVKPLNLREVSYVRSEE